MISCAWTASTSPGSSLAAHCRTPVTCILAEWSSGWLRVGSVPDGISSAHDLFPETSLLELSSPGTGGVCCQDITKLQFCCRDELKEGLHEGNPLLEYKRFIFTDEGCESCKHCPTSFIPVDKAVESKRTSQPVAQILKINQQEAFFLVSKEVFFLNPCV